MLIDPERFDLRGTLEHGKDVEIDVNVIVEGNVRLGDRVKIGAGCVLKNVTIGDDVEIKPYSVLEDATIGEKAAIGPFSRLRPGAELAAETHVGNFVEIKNPQWVKALKSTTLLMWVILKSVKTVTSVRVSLLVTMTVRINLKQSLVTMYSWAQIRS